jgi:hypothetical protein
LQVIASIASQTAIALDNANLYAAAREELIAARQLAALGTVTAAIQHRINNTLDIIGPNITRLHKRVDTSDKPIKEIWTSSSVTRSPLRITSPAFRNRSRKLNFKRLTSMRVCAMLRLRFGGNIRTEPGLEQ